MIQIYALIVVAVIAVIAYLYMKYKKRNAKIASIKKAREVKDGADEANLLLTPDELSKKKDENKQEETGKIKEAKGEK